MQELIAAYWMWMIVALLAGGAVGYWLPGQPGTGRLLSWGAAVVFVGLAIAAPHLFPPGEEPDFETFLVLSFWFALGGLLGSWLRAAVSRAELARAALASNAQVESAVLSARAKAAVRSVQDEAASTKAAEDARLAAEAKAAELVRVAAAAKVAEDERLAAEAKAAEEARAAAAAKATEDARLAVEAKAAELARVAAAKAAEEDRLAAEAKAARQARLAVAAKALENARLAVEARAAELAHVAGAPTAAEDDRMATEAKAAEEARLAAATKPAGEPGVAATIAQPDAFQGIAAPEADDLKLIKGIGPKSEKACNALGVYQFRQIADWTPEEAIRVGQHIAFPGRIEREHWIAQARLLASGGETEHSRAVKSGAIVVDDKADEPLDPAAAETLGKSLPEQAAVVDGEDKHPGRRPYSLATAFGNADDLKRIRGIGPQNAGRLHKLGIWHFWQVAAWTDENVKWVGSYLAFSGRIHRESWVAQARDLAAGKEPEPPRRVSGKVAASKDDGSLGGGNVPTSK
jgi:predicted flap endonuclease-1-like 5' DNA nuclease